MRLAADVGGTKTAIALIGDDGAIQREETLPSGDYADLAALVVRFLEGARPRAACFAVAGPLRGDQAHLTNLGWTVEAAAFPFDVRLIHDGEAMARAVSGLPADALVELQHGERQPGAPVAVVAPGTGLGFAYALAGHAAASEAGHATYAPADERERAWCDHLAARFGRVSRERACSGSTYPMLVEFAGPDAPELFARILGGLAGDWALEIGATGGLYVAGGMAPRVLPSAAFLDGFLNKGRFRAYAERVPVSLVTDPRLALRGAIAALPD